MGDESWRPDWPISCQRRWLRFCTWQVPSTQPTRSSCVCCSRPDACRRPRGCREPCRRTRRWTCWGARWAPCRGPWRGVSFGLCRGMSGLCRGTGRALCRGASRGPCRRASFGAWRGTSGLGRGLPAGCGRAGGCGPGWSPRSEAGEGLRSGGSLQESSSGVSGRGQRSAGSSGQSHGTPSTGGGGRGGGCTAP